MNKIKYLKNSDISQIIIKSERGQIIDERGVYAVEKNQLTGFLNLSIEKNGDSFKLVYNTMKYSSLKEYLDGINNLDKQTFLNFLNKIVQPLQCVQDANFKPESVLLDINYSFIDSDKERVYFVFLPLTEPKDFGSLKDFLLMIITYSNFASGVDVEFVNEFRDYINSVPDFSVFDLCDCISYMSEGEPLSALFENRGLKCPSCGSPITRDIKFCANCGFNVTIVTNAAGSDTDSKDENDGAKSSAPVMPIDLMGLPSKPLQIKIAEPQSEDESTDSSQLKSNKKSKPPTGNKFIPDKEIHRVNQYWANVNAAHNDALEREELNAAGYAKSGRNTVQKVSSPGYRNPNTRMPQYPGQNRYNAPPSQYGNVNTRMPQYQNPNRYPQPPVSQYGNVNTRMPQYQNPNRYPQPPVLQYGNVNTRMPQYQNPNRYPQPPVSQYGNINTRMPQYQNPNGYPQVPVSQYGNINTQMPQYQNPNGYPQVPMSQYGNVNTQMPQYQNPNGYPQAPMSQYGNINTQMPQYQNPNRYPQPPVSQYGNINTQMPQYQNSNGYPQVPMSQYGNVNTQMPQVPHQDGNLDNAALQNEKHINAQSDIDQMISLDYGNNSQSGETAGQSLDSEDSMITSLDFGLSQDNDQFDYTYDYSDNNVQLSDNNASLETEVNNSVSPYGDNYITVEMNPADSYENNDNNNRMKLCLDTISSLDEGAYLIRCSTGEKTAIDKPEFIVGRMMGVDYAVSDNDAIGRQHVMITEKNGKYFIRDLASTNGTFIEKIKIPQNTDFEILSGCSITLANEEFEFIIKDKSF